MYDTRLYTEVYNTIVIDTVLRQRQSGIEPTKVAARSAMSREFVTFFEKDCARFASAERRDIRGWPTRRSRAVGECRFSKHHTAPKISLGRSSSADFSHC